MRKGTSLFALCAAGVFSLSLGTACLVPAPPAGAVVVSSGPPVAEVEVVGVAPGPEYLWVPGYHRWDGVHYVWVSGRWEHRPRANATWQQGTWRHHSSGWYWTEGRWR